MLSASPRGFPAISATESISTPAQSREELVPRSLISGLAERNAPTLWPPRANDLVPIERAIRLCEEENQKLKTLVISLSEIVLNSVIDGR
jgi:hypothetical protein